MRPTLLLAALSAAALLHPAAAGAAAPKPDRARAAVLDALSACRKDADDATRLACYDKAAGALDEAETKGQVVVLDRAQVRTVKREAFGLSLPSINLFARRGAPDEVVDRVSYTIDHATQGGSGKWVFATIDGAVWEQTDADESLARDPHKGSTLAVRHGALSSYFCNVDGQRALRCQRQH